ncbi:putative N-acetyltransferase, MSMEG_0567 N-terminal domain family [Microlunatus sagamiharensis]|uniref:Putative N-acetyltransferase, MSMEG_0567 N-terminal domain family n=1 Tax=Microlunatus sagamiharensis TaxID=546874 RepID=A0A1H2M2U4_9ACTN|nr:MSMEG_0567/sll0787 family protein [Microlunatus sagamiharensis]SDU87560.1 putative N-acetyltransferase, MSMEG_0567 N-terminal domain family [Microlunatus sagamiharensis]
MALFDVEVLTRGATGSPASAATTVGVAEDRADLDAARRLRHATFVLEQGLFAGSDRDDTDDDPRALTLVARDPAGVVTGTVRLAPATGDRDLGWWVGSRLAVARPARGHGAGVGAALVRAACAHAERLGALRFDAHVQRPNAPLFRRLGWEEIGDEVAYGRPHVAMTWPVDRVARLAARTKAPLGPLLAPFAGGPAGLGGRGFLGDDAAPVPGSDLVAATDAILPSMVERDPTWAGWCAVLVNLNDLAATGAEPVALLDAVGARDASFASRVVRGVAAAAAAWDVPVVGGHTQLGVPGSLSVTALGRTPRPVPGGGGRPGHAVTVTADLGGGWRPGYSGAQWDSTSGRTTEDLQALGSFVARSAPAAAKDVSMAGLVGTLGMLAEASGCGAVLDVDAVPTPAGATTGDWLTCFPGFAMVTADEPGREPAPAGPATSRACGELTTGAGVRLHWPDGRTTPALTTVTGLGRA